MGPTAEPGASTRTSGGAWHRVCCWRIDPVAGCVELLHELLGELLIGRR